MARAKSHAGIGALVPTDNKAMIESQALPTCARHPLPSAPAKLVSVEDFGYTAELTCLPREMDMHFRLRLCASPLLFAVFCCLPADGQIDTRQPYVFLPNQEVGVVALPSVVADSKTETTVLMASLATALLEPDICCAPKSALENRISSAKGLPLKDLGEKLRGRAYLDDGSPIMVADKYWPAASVRPEDILNSLMAQHPFLMDWSGHLYVLYGAVFDEYKYQDGTRSYFIHTLMLVDTHFSDSRRLVSFDRQTEDWGKVTGLLQLTVTRNQ
jgi:hypothetical protein